MPASFTIPSQFNVTAIVTTLGIDSKENELEVTAQFIKPQSTQGFGQKFQHLSGTGEDINMCFEQIEMQIGRTLVLAHCSTIVISDDVCKQYNMLKLLDGILRNNELGNNSLIIHTPDKAKDVLNATAKEELISQDLLVDIANYDTNQLYSEKIDMFSFFNNSIAPSGTAVIPSVGLSSANEDSNTSGGQSAGGGDSMESGGSAKDSTGSGDKTISNKGDVCVFVDGNYVNVFTYDEMKGFNWLDSTTKENIFTIEEYSSDTIKNATIQFENLGQSVSFDAKIINNIPVIKVDISVDAKIMMLTSDNEKVTTKNIKQNDEMLNSKFKELVNKEIGACMKLSRENGFDKLDFYHKFEMKNYKEWKKYLNSLTDSGSYMQYVIVDVNANLIQKSE